MARQFAIVFGAVYVLIGVLGFILPSPRLGIFGVNVLHDLVHLVIGGLWLVAAFAAPMGPNSHFVTAALALYIGFMTPRAAIATTWRSSRARALPQTGHDSSPGRSHPYRGKPHLREGS